MDIQVLDSLTSVEATEWNALVADNNPFLKHEFLSALERHDCVSLTSGWQPSHIVIRDDDNRLVAASPLYIKHHSHGEFVFDWSWAESYQRNRLTYYPKLISAIPFTPMTGQRLLVARDDDPNKLRRQLLTATLELLERQGLSSMHWLFPNDEETEWLRQQGLSIRLGCQYHWHNRDYRNFDDYLSHFSSRKRKNVVKERRQVVESGVELVIKHGDEITPQEWQRFHRFYREIYDRKWGFPSLTLGFFEEIGRTLADQIVMVLAYRDSECIATALNLRSDTTLYGRHWGCSEQIPALHFEACYYQGLEYCIEHSLQTFEPGAQGEHKIARGFLPTPTWSAHWMAHAGFHEAVADFTRREEMEMKRVIEELNAQSPFKAGTT